MFIHENFHIKETTPKTVAFDNVGKVLTHLPNSPPPPPPPPPLLLLINWTKLQKHAKTCLTDILIFHHIIASQVSHNLNIEETATMFHVQALVIF